MLRSCTAIFLSAGLCTAFAWAQYDGDHDSKTQNVAYVYVSNNPANTGDNQIHAFRVRADGRLLPVPRSPFRIDDTALSASGDHLFAVNRTAPYIDTYSIQDDGTLEFLRSTNYSTQNPSDCGSAGWLFSDRSSADLYAMNFRGDCANNTYQSYAVQGTTGNLGYLGSANGGAGSFSGVYLPATFLGNNNYAYEATNNTCMYFAVQGFRRQSNGLLADAGISTTLPAPPPNYRIYIPTFAAADASNHVAITLLPANPPGCTAEEKVQVASFTAAADGDLTTTNTYATMPASSIANVTDLKISPEGDLIAVGGAEGLQLFHFNGDNPATPYTGILTVDAITQMFWDNSNHLYAISQMSGRLHVFTISATSYHEAPGSPYPIRHPEYLAVKSLR